MRNLIPILFCSFLTIGGFAQDFQKSVASSELTLSLDSVVGEIGDTVHVSLRCFEFVEIYALFGTLQYDATSLELFSYNPDSLANNLSVNLDTAGQVPFSWFFTNPIGATFPDSSSLFSIDFKIISAEGSTLTFTDSPNQLEYWSDYTPFGGWNIYVPDTLSGQVSHIGTTVGSIETLEKNIIVYPNPASGQVRIDFGKTVRGATLQVINVMGTVASTLQLNELQYFDLELPKAKGIYFLQLTTTDGQVETLKIVKE